MLLAAVRQHSAPDAITDDFNRLPFRGQSDESVVFPGVQMIGEENIVIGDGEYASFKELGLL